VRKSHPRRQPPHGENRTVTSRRLPNRDLRTREHLTEHEVEVLVKSLSRNRNGPRDSLMALMAFRHALRAQELVDLRWDQVDFRKAVLNVRRVKNGTPSTHPLTGRELRGLRRLKREQQPPSPFVFVSEHGTPFTTSGFAKMVKRATVGTELESLRVHVHMLRHSAGFHLVNKGTDARTIQAYLGHSCLNHVTRYTQLASDRFNGLFKD
jgi:integrase